MLQGAGVSASFTTGRGGRYAHVRRVACEFCELLDAGAPGGATFRIWIALLNRSDARYDLVNAQRGLVTESEVLRDSVEARDRLDARDDVSVCVVHVRYGQHLRRQEHAKRRQRRPLPQETCALNERD